jgi:NCAIR mutase (PurE)-related protein
VTPDSIRRLLESVGRGEVGADEAVEKLKHMPFADLGFAKVDHHRELRHGLAEVVYGEGKTPEQIVAIVNELVQRHGGALVTRLDAGAGAELASAVEGFRYNSIGRIGSAGSRSAGGGAIKGSVAIVTAGTSDQPIAEEAAETLDFLGIRTDRHSDVGVAGIHRLLASRVAIGDASVAIVVAGMEGALPSVVGGLVDIPIIAVPTSIGYGASFGGLSALLAMLNSCAAGVTVVNIDNGFGAAVAASLILRTAART